MPSHKLQRPFYIICSLAIFVIGCSGADDAIRLSDDLYRSAMKLPAPYNFCLVGFISLVLCVLFVAAAKGEESNSNTNDQDPPNSESSIIIPDIISGKNSMTRMEQFVQKKRRDTLQAEKRDTRKSMRDLLLTEFKLYEIPTICFDYYPEIYAQFKQGISVNEKIYPLIDYQLENDSFFSLLQILSEKSKQAARIKFESLISQYRDLDERERELTDEIEKQSDSENIQKKTSPSLFKDFD